MNRFTIAVGAGAAALVLTGCGPRLAQGPYGAEELRWQKTLRDNYSGYEAPQTAPPAIRDNVSPRLLEEEEMRRNAQPASNQPPAADDPTASPMNPAQMVDNAADQPAAVQEQPAAKPAEAKPAKPAEAKVAAAKAEKPAGGEYVVKPGDTLGALAKKFYGDARRSDVIVRANPSLKDPNKLKPGTKLTIPKI